MHPWRLTRSTYREEDTLLLQKETVRGEGSCEQSAQPTRKGYSYVASHRFIQFQLCVSAPPTFYLEHKTADDHFLLIGKGSRSVITAALTINPLSAINYVMVVMKFSIFFPAVAGSTACDVM